MSIDNRRSLLVGMALLTLTIPTIAQPTPYNPTDQATNQAQRDYYAIPYAMQLTVLTDAIKAGQGKLDDSTAIQASMADAESFEVSVNNIATGKTADIQNEELIDFVTVPVTGQEVIYLNAAEPGKGRSTVLSRLSGVHWRSSSLLTQPP